MFVETSPQIYSSNPLQKIKENLKLPSEIKISKGAKNNLFELPFMANPEVISIVADELKNHRVVPAKEIHKISKTCGRAKHFWSSHSEFNSAENMGSMHDIPFLNSVQKSVLSHSEMNTDGMRSSSLMLESENFSEYSQWRSELAKVDVWYASYGSNMWKQRFMCYIEGGKVKDMNMPCRGCKDKTEPKAIKWKMVPHKLFFARSSSVFWGAGGVTFLHPQVDIRAKSYVCMYKITLEQFNDVLFQENHRVGEETKSPLIELPDLDIAIENKSLNIEPLKNTWYNNVVFLGTEDDIPILTMTCSSLDIKRYKSTELPMLPPPKEYVNTLIRGLVEGEQFAEEEANEYIHAALDTTLAKNL